MSEYRTFTFSPELVNGISLVGKVVHVPYRPGQFRVHSVEGFDWYAFDRKGETIVDLAMTASDRHHAPIVTVLPMGAQMGDGFAETYPVDQVRRGVNLVKSWV